MKLIHDLAPSLTPTTKGGTTAAKLLKPVKDPSRLVKIDFEVRYEECDLAPRHLESHPVLQIYLGAQFVRDAESGGVVNIYLNEDVVGGDQAPVYKGSLVGTLRRDQGRALPLGAPIGMCSYAVHRNDIGSPCFVDVGTSFALLGDVVAEWKHRGYYAHSHELLMRNVTIAGEEPLKKGVIGLRITKVELGTSVALPGQLPAIGTQALVLQRIAAVQAREETVNAYVRATMQHEQQFPDSLPNISRVRVPMDISETGIMSTGRMFMPIAAYAMVETPNSNPDFFVNAFERVMARWNMKPAAYNAFDLKQKARCMAKVIAYPVQSIDYIGDAHYSGPGRTARKMINARTFNASGTTFSAQDAPVHVPEENMSNALIAAAGDCEDLNTAAVSIMHALIATKFDPNNPKHAPLIELQRIAAQYIPISALAVVHGAKIGDEEGYGAHMYLPLFPRQQFMDGLARTKDGRAFLERLQPAPVPVAETIRQQAGPAAEKLPNLFIEGTGIIDTLGYDDPLIEQRRYVSTCLPSFRGLKTEIPHKEKAPSNFYLAITNGISDFMVKREGLPVAGFVFGQVSPKGSPHEMTRGVLYEDVLRSSDKLAISPQPFIPNTVMSLIGDANALRPPVPDQVLDWSKPMAGPERDPHLDRLVEGVRAFKRSPPKVPPPGSVDYIVKPHQYGKVKIAQMLADAAKCEKLYDVSYELEHITNSVYTYRLRLWVK